MLIAFVKKKRFHDDGPNAPLTSHWRTAGYLKLQRVSTDGGMAPVAGTCINWKRSPAGPRTSGQLHQIAKCPDSISLPIQKGSQVTCINWKWSPAKRGPGATQAVVAPAHMSADAAGASPAMSSGAQKCKGSSWSHCSRRRKPQLHPKSARRTFQEVTAPAHALTTHWAVA